MTRVKICGLTREADVRAAVDAGADAVGFVADVPIDTPRELSPRRTADLVAGVPPFVTSVLVTMPGRPEPTVDLVERVGPDAVQLHGDLPEGDVAYLSANVPARVVVAVPAGDPEAADGYDDIADALLVDTADADGAGGTGRTHDWAATADLVGRVDSPVVLAGGLDPDNVAAAVRAVEPFGVDVASGVESAGGRKDHEAVRSFVRNAGRRPARAGPEP